MKYFFKQAAQLNGHRYQLGAHEVPPEHQDHTFKLFMKHGLIVESDPVQEDKHRAATESFSDRQRKLYENPSKHSEAKEPKAEKPKKKG